MGQVQRPMDIVSLRIDNQVGPPTPYLPQLCMPVQSSMRNPNTTAPLTFFHATPSVWTMRKLYNTDLLLGFVRYVSSARG